MKKDRQTRLMYARWLGIRLAMILFDVLAVNFSYYIALIIRYYVNFEMADKASVYLTAFAQFAPYYTVCCLIVFFCFKLYSGRWKYAGLNDMNRIIFANVITAVIQVAGTWLFVRRMTVTYYLLGAAIQFLLIAASRFSFRLLSAEKTKMSKGRSGTAINVMIVGVGETGRIVRKKLDDDHGNAAHPVCVFTCRSNEGGGMMNGIPVVSGMDRLKDAIQRYHVECVILADSLLPEETRKQIKDICQEADVGVQDFSGYFQNDAGSLSFRKLMEYTGGTVETVIDGKAQTFANGEQALMSIAGQYDVKAISAQGDKLVVELSRHLAVLNNVNETWVREFEKETGESVSFF